MRIRRGWLAVLVALVLVFLSDSVYLAPESVFGVYVGSVNLRGLSLEHEAVGAGVLVAAFSFYTKGSGFWFLILAAGVVLVVSEIQRGFIDVFLNPTGAWVSMSLGAIFTCLLFLSLGYRYRLSSM